MVVDTPNRTTHYTHTSYATEVRFTCGECYFTQQHVCLLPGLHSSLFPRSFCLISWLERVGRPVIVLPLFLLQALPVISAVPAPILPFPYFPPQLSHPPPFSTLPIGPASHCGWSRLSSISPPSPCSHHYTFSLSRPGLSLWQVPPCVSPFYLSTSHIHTTLISIYTPATTSLLARLVIVAGPPTSPTFQHFLTPYNTLSLFILLLSPSPSYTSPCAT